MTGRLWLSPIRNLRSDPPTAALQPTSSSRNQGQLRARHAELVALRTAAFDRNEAADAALEAAKASGDPVRIAAARQEAQD